MRRIQMSKTSQPPSKGYGPNRRDIETRGYRPKPNPNAPKNPKPPNVGSALRPPPKPKNG